MVSRNNQNPSKHEIVLPPGVTKEDIPDLSGKTATKEAAAVKAEHAIGRMSKLIADNVYKDIAEVFGATLKRLEDRVTHIEKELRKAGFEV